MCSSHADKHHKKHKKKKKRKKHQSKKDLVGPEPSVSTDKTPVSNKGGEF